MPGTCGPDFLKRRCSFRRLPSHNFSILLLSLVTALAFGLAEEAGAELLPPEDAAVLLEKAAQSTHDNHERIKTSHATYKYIDTRVLRGNDALHFAERHGIKLPNKFELIEVIERGHVNFYWHRTDDTFLSEVVPDNREALVKRTFTDSRKHALSFTTKKVYHGAPVSLYAEFGDAGAISCHVATDHKVSPRGVLDPRFPCMWPRPPWEILGEAAELFRGASPPQNTAKQLKLYPTTTNGRHVYRLVMPSGDGDGISGKYNIHLNPEAGLNISTIELIDKNGHTSARIQMEYTQCNQIHVPQTVRYIDVVDDRYIGFERCLELERCLLNSPDFEKPVLQMLGLPDGQVIKNDDDMPCFVFKAGNLVSPSEAALPSPPETQGSEKARGQPVYFWATLATACAAALLIWYLLRGSKSIERRG